jgi:hypothetical protein
VRTAAGPVRLRCPRSPSDPSRSPDTAAVLPSTTREILLADIPDGLPGPEHLTVTRKPVPVPGPGQVVVRNRHFLVFPGLRTLIGGQADGVPLPPHPRR